MSEINDLHRKAMDFAEMAFTARLDGDLQRAGELLRQAFENECEAAELIAMDMTAEPTRSVLHRSAASLAIDCGELREAERLIAIALAGNPPLEIADELRDLREEVHIQKNSTVKPLWEETVSVNGVLTNKDILLEDASKAVE